MTILDLKPFFDALGSVLGGPLVAIILVGALLKIAAILAHVLGIVPLIIVAERKILGWIQDRPGPNRVGPFGLLQGIADGVKLLMKEDFIPSGADRVLYLIGPALVIIPAFLALCIIPWGPMITGTGPGEPLYEFLNLWGMTPYLVQYPEFDSMQLAITNPNIGILYVFAITSVGVYGITLAGWSSENKWSLLGGIRASAQMISYEISLSLSIIGVLLIVGSLNMYDIVDSQAGGFWRWHIFAQPVGFVLFVIAMFAETNRLPFDLAEGEAELTGGFHTEYSSMKFALFFLGEYTNMITVSAVCCTLFLGGYLLVPMDLAVGAVTGVLGFFNEWVGFGLTPGAMLGIATFIAASLAPLGLALKIGVLVVIFIMARGLYPRFRYDQVMNLGWKIMLPIGLVNLLVTGVGIMALTWIAAGVVDGLDRGQFNQIIADWKWVIGLVTLGMLLAAEFYATRNRRTQMRRDYMNLGLGPARRSAVRRRPALSTTIVP